MSKEKLNIEQYIEIWDWIDGQFSLRTLVGKWEVIVTQKIISNHLMVITMIQIYRIRMGIFIVHTKIN